LRARAEEQPDGLGYEFLADGETDELKLSYAEADLRARAIGASLREAGADPGSRAILILPPGLEYVTALFGCLYAGVVAVPVYPPDPLRLERTLPRLLAILRDADPVVALTTAPLLGFLDEVTSLAPDFGALRWLAVDDVPDPAAGQGGPAPIEPGATALLQYTSGSTSAPRGVSLSHANLLHNSGQIRNLFRTTRDSRAVVWLPPYHDMGLIGGLLQPLHGGFPVTLMSPLHFLEQPMRWLRAIDRVGATVSGGPNFAYDLCVRKSTPELVAQLDLSSWQVAFNGAEPIRPETLQRFASTFAPAGFRPDAFLPCYGLAEATLIVSGTGGRAGPAGPPGPTAIPTVRLDRAALERHVVATATDGPAVSLVSCGRGAADQRIVIVDAATAEVCQAGQVGEVWVSGPSIAQGYWGRPEETSRVFRARIEGRHDGPFLRTGDLGFLHDGELVVTGRLKDLIIVRGRNYYPHDIELTAERADPVLRPGCTAAFLLEDDHADGRLVLVHEVRRRSGVVDIGRVAGLIRQAVADEHGLSVHTVVLTDASAMPKTSSGKVQRWLCRTRFLAGDLPEVGRSDLTAAAVGAVPDPEQLIAAPAEERAALLETYLRGQVAAVGGQHDLDGRQPLLAAGLDSLAIMQLKHRVETDLAVNLSLTAMLTGASLSETAERLNAQVGMPAVDETGPSAPADRAAATVEHLAPLTYGQRWMWLVQQLEPESTAYTIAAAFRLPESVDRPALRRALDALVARHPVLRTTFPVRDGQPVQLVRPSGHAAYREHDTAELDEAALIQRLTSAARAPFDLEAGPLLRVDLYGQPGGEVMLLAVHHIVTDFWSMSILARELGVCYTAYTRGLDPALPPPNATYLDVVDWQHTVLGDEALAGPLERYWDGQVGAGVPALALPAVDAAPGGSRPFSLSPALTRQLRSRAAAEKVTPYVLLLATFQTLLHRHTGQNELALGAGVAARTRPEFAEVVGCCTNLVIILSHAEAGESFRALLSRTQERVVGALEHQDYPMTLLAKRHRAARRGGLFDALFTWNRSPDHGEDLAALLMLGPPGVRRSIGSLQVENFPLPPDESRLPVELVMADVAGATHGLLRYRGDSLEDGAAAQLVRRFVDMLEAVAADPDVPFDELAPSR
jgi:acyl-CoA synthetase (AMP-forming)/AMP-acid ligase II